MDAGTRQRVSQVLEHHPHYKALLTANVPDGVSTDEWAFIMAATWPDWVRPAYPGEPYKPRSITKYHHPTWHYIDDFFVPPADRGKVKTPPAPATEPTDRPTDAVQCIDNSIAQIVDPKTSLEDRAIYLAWLEHVVGDIHQPLHAACEISTRFPDSSGDRGGNSQAILVNGRAMNLHAFWDDLLGTDTSYAYLEKAAAEIEADPAAQARAMPQLRTDRTPDAWAKESFALAVKYAYLDGNLTTENYHYRMPADGLSPLPARYAETAHQLAMRQIALAADRLAELMKELFGS
jgi:hypothetical protein